MPSMAMLTTPARSQETPLSAPSVIGVAKLRRGRQHAEDQHQDRLVAERHARSGGAARAYTFSPQLVLSAGRAASAAAYLDAVDRAHDAVGSHEDQDQGLDDGDDLPRHLAVVLHLRGSRAQGAEEQGGDDHAEGMAAAEQGDGDAVEAVAAGEAEPEIAVAPGLALVTSSATPCTSTAPARPGQHAAEGHGQDHVAGNGHPGVAGGEGVGPRGADFEAPGGAEEEPPDRDDGQQGQQHAAVQLQPRREHRQPARWAPAAASARRPSLALHRGRSTSARRTAGPGNSS